MAKIEDEKAKAINYGLKVLQLSSGDIDLLMELGSLYIDVEDYDNAITVFKDVIERMPTYPKVHYYLSRIYLKQGKRDEAVKEADEEIKQNPNSELGYFAKARVMYSDKQYVVANKLLEKSISVNGDFVDGLKLLALIKKKQNYLDQAKELYLRARRVDQGDAEVHKNLGDIYERTGQRSLAYESYKVYLEIDVNAPDRSRIEAKMRRLR
jgi:tetratricopeptide (TPR) repeat protein